MHALAIAESLKAPRWVPADPRPDATDEAIARAIDRFPKLWEQYQDNPAFVPPAGWTPPATLNGVPRP